MTGSVINDTALLVGAVAGLVGAVAVLVAVIMRRGMMLRLGAMHAEVSQINKAVNHVGPNTPPLVERVGLIERKQEWQMKALIEIANGVGVDLIIEPE